MASSCALAVWWTRGPLCDRSLILTACSDIAFSAPSTHYGVISFATYESAFVLPFVPKIHFAELLVCDGALPDSCYPPYPPCCSRLDSASGEPFPTMYLAITICRSRCACPTPPRSGHPVFSVPTLLDRFGAPVPPPCAPAPCWPTPSFPI